MPKLENIEIAVTSAKKKSRVESRYARFDPRNRSYSRSRYFYIPWLASNFEQTKSYDLSKSAIFSDFPLKSMNPVQSRSHPLANLVHQSDRRVSESKKCTFVLNYVPRRWQDMIKIAPELFLECQTICRKILANSKLCDFYLIVG